MYESESEIWALAVGISEGTVTNPIHWCICNIYKKNASTIAISRRLVKQHNIDMLAQAIIYLSLHLRPGEGFHFNPKAYYNAKRSSNIHDAIQNVTRFMEYRPVGGGKGRSGRGCALV